MNIFISISYLLITFIITILFYKQFGKVGLYIWISLLVIISNIQTIKISEIMGLTLSLGNIPYAAIFLSTDILNEKYGEKTAKLALKFSFVVMIVFTILMTLFLQYIPSDIDDTQKSLEIIFNYMPRVTIGSLLAYYISQTIDIKVYQCLKNKYNKIWISNNISTITSQLIDTLIFILICFIGILTINDLIELFITMIIFKCLIAILDTPFMLLANKINAKEVI